MIQVLVHHEVNDYRSWRSVFDAAIDFRHLGGEFTRRFRAQTDKGLTCFLLPRHRPDDSRNQFYIQRLKNKLGNCSNASSEVEFRGALAWMIGAVVGVLPAYAFVQLIWQAVMPLDFHVDPVAFAVMLVASVEGAVVLSRAEKSLEPFETVAQQLITQARALASQLRSTGI